MQDLDSMSCTHTLTVYLDPDLDKSCLINGPYAKLRAHFGGLESQFSRQKMFLGKINVCNSVQISSPQLIISKVHLDVNFVLS